MSVGRFFRLSFSILIAGSFGCLALLVLGFAKLWQSVEAMSVKVTDQNFQDFSFAFSELAPLFQGVAAVFLATAISGIALSEFLKTRSLTFYAGATGALSVLLAIALSNGLTPMTNANSAAVFAIAGFIAGALYWLLSGRVA